MDLTARHHRHHRDASLALPDGDEIGTQRGLVGSRIGHWHIQRMRIEKSEWWQ
jgi:hypothetical protein